MNERAEIVICGAGIAGVATAYHLAVGHGLGGIVLVDERPPLTLTSDKSTECYRNFWPGPDGAMVAMMNRSIDLLEGWARQSGNVFHLNRRGYLFVTGDPTRVAQYEGAAHQAQSYGAGPIRIHRRAEAAYSPAIQEGFEAQPTGADLLLDSALRRHFPYLSNHAVAALHVRRAGWLSAQQLGMYLLRESVEAGVRVLQDRVVDVAVQANRIRSVELDQRGRLRTAAFINAAGPGLEKVAALTDAQVPVFAELHQKAAFQDALAAVPREAPLLIWSDPQILPWTPDERQALREDPDLAWMVEELPGGAHTRPEGGRGSEIVLALWEYNPPIMEPAFPPPLDPLYPEITIRGLGAMLPGLRAYLTRLPRPALDGGYYIKTRENRPLAGPTSIEGIYLIGALSGFGIMAAPALGELVAAHLTGASLPPHATAFQLDRYQDPGYQAKLESWGDSWQL